MEEEDVAFFKKLLGEERVVTDFYDLEKYNVDWFQQYRGRFNKKRLHTI